MKAHGVDVGLVPPENLLAPSGGRACVAEIPQTDGAVDRSGDEDADGSGAVRLLPQTERGNVAVVAVKTLQLLSGLDVPLHDLHVAGP